jgi:WD40 repeat protein
VLGNTVSNNQPGPVVGVTKHVGPIRAVAYRPDGEMVASGGADGSVLLWPDQAGVAASKLTGHTAAVNAVAFDRTGATLASAGDDRTVRLWSPSSLAPLGSPYDQARSVVDAIAFSPKETDLLATASRDGVVRLWRFG